eukprot:2570535-Pyramimonas_sp.AAC.2
MRRLLDTQGRITPLLSPDLRFAISRRGRVGRDVQTVPELVFRRWSILCKSEELARRRNALPPRPLRERNLL